MTRREIITGKENECKRKGKEINNFKNVSCESAII